MNSWSSFAVLLAVCGLAAAGHYHHDGGHDGHGDNGGAGVAVHYSVVTEHKADHHGHGGGAGGHDAGHATVHTWGQDAAAGHDEGHSDDGHDAGYYGGHDDGHSYGEHVVEYYGGHDDGHSYGGHDSGHYGGHDGGHDDGHDHHAYPKYEFSYGVKDPKTGDIKSQSETRDGGNVKGSYTVKEADGTTRHVEYSADKHKGFNAVVHTSGKANADHDAEYAHGGHDNGYEHGYSHGHGKASSYVIVKKQEETKH
ncbi:adult-specific cuticular protein ACP-22-like [Lucilia sericata]|uniref:adult-specific cuticular protein ACP-22-like n=1 Tax=Lucilia sericata TaxID=13632 RepID=UPI0018A81D53|nr:adult-specific cuticular protein ACP-22-like [Lucilia sericata]